MLRFIIFSLMSMSAALAQNGWIKAPGQIEITGSWNFNDPSLVKANKELCLRGAVTRAQENLIGYYYNTSDKPYSKWVISDFTRNELERNKEQVERELCKMETSVRDLGFKTQFVPQINKNIQTWTAEVSQNLKKIEVITVKRLEKNCAALEKSSKKDPGLINGDELIAIKRMVGEIMIDLSIFDILLNMKPYFERYPGQKTNFKNGLMSYIPPKSTPFLCIKAIGIIDGISDGFIKRIKGWDNYKTLAAFNRKLDILVAAVVDDGPTIKSVEQTTKNQNDTDNAVSGQSSNSSRNKANGELRPDSELLDADFSQLKVTYQPPPPKYPLMAKLAKIQGTVIVEVLVGTDGVPLSAKAIKGPSELIPTAEDYAMKWRFQPALLQGVPTKVRFRLTLPFQL